MKLFVAFNLLGFLLTRTLAAQYNSEDKVIDPVNYLTGFVRSGFYASPGIEDLSTFSSLYSELSVKLELKGNALFSGESDTRIRYGQEFGRSLKALDIRELFVKLTTDRLDLTFGQQIVKWGKADFSNPVSKLCSRDYRSRLPEAEDPDQGNLIARARWYPLHFLTIEAVTGPFYRPSVLITEPMDIPSYITINKLPDLLTGRSVYCYGIKAGFNMPAADFSFSWYEGPDPLPGFKLEHFDIDLSSPLPAPEIILSLTPSKIRNLGLDFETTAGKTGLRCEAAWTFPSESCQVVEYAQCEQLAWVAGLDRSAGRVRLFAEYSGKFLPGFQSSGAEPILGTEPDINSFLLLFTQPGFDAGAYVRNQVSAFNRLAFYQLEEWYHQLSARAEAEFLNGIINTSLTTQYIFTTDDFFLRSDIRLKPSDGLTLYGGLEFYKGPDGSVFGIIDEFMSGVFLGARIDFSIR